MNYFYVVRNNILTFLYCCFCFRFCSVFKVQIFHASDKAFRKSFWGSSPNCSTFSHEMVGLRGLEPPTSRLSGVRSNHLSYKPKCVLAAVVQLSSSVRPGGDEEDRTPDPLLARQVLSQLSYTPMWKPFCFRAGDRIFSLISVLKVQGLHPLN